MSRLAEQGYVFNLPPQPPLKQIDGYKRPVAEQYFRRPYDEALDRMMPPNHFDMTLDERFDMLPFEDKKDLMELEDDRCYYGYWFMNKGVPTYVTGDHYFFITYWHIDGNHTYYLDHQREDFYFYKLCEDDPQCFGSIELKPRRAGYTHMKLAMILNKARIVHKKRFGIISKTEDDAKKFNFDQLVNGFIDLPSWMKPEVAGDFPPKTTLEFSAPRKRLSKANQKEVKSAGNQLQRTRIDFEATDAKAYDGFKLVGLLMDEGAKWKTADLDEAWITHRKCLSVGTNIIGKVWILSTIEGSEEKEATLESIESFKKVWMKSDATKKNQMGRTESGLNRWFIPGWMAMFEGMNLEGKPFTDRYGFLDELACRLAVLDEYESKTDPREKILVKRQYPFTVQEALSSMGNTAKTFVNIHQRLVDRFDYLQAYNELPYEERASRPQAYRTGRLEWINNERFGKVRFIDDPNGRFNIAYLPTVAGALMDNRVKEIMQDRYAPYSDSPFVVGLDPVEYEEVQYGEGSKPAFHVYLKYNINNPEMSDLYCLEYFGRPDIPIFREDFYKALFFYGAKTNIERQAGQALFENMKANGMKAFIMKRQMSWNAKTDKDKSLGTPTSPRSIQSGLELIENRFSLPNPEVNENEKDNLKYFWFDRSLKQLIEYDIKNKTKFDLVSSMIQTEFASQIMKKRKIMELHNQELEDQQEVSRSPTIFDYLAPIHDNGAVITHFQHERNQRRNANY